MIIAALLAATAVAFIAALAAWRFRRQARHWRIVAAWWEKQACDIVENGVGWRRPPSSRRERARA